MTFVDTYWESSKEKPYPGLDRVKKMDNAKQKAQEIEELIPLCRSLHSQALFPDQASQASKQKVERALFVEAELSAALEFLLDDGVDEPADEAFAAAKARDDDSNSLSSLSQALSDYTEIADDLKTRLQQLDDFDEKMIAEAKSLSQELSKMGTPTSGRPSSPYIRKRNQFLHLVKTRVDRIRKSARYVYRNHPEIRQKSSSTYERRKRLAARRKKQAEALAPEVA